MRKYLWPKVLVILLLIFMLERHHGSGQSQTFCSNFFSTLFCHTLWLHTSPTLSSASLWLSAYLKVRGFRQQLISCQDDIDFTGRVQVGVKPVTVLSSSFSCSPSPQGFGTMLSSWKCTSTCGEGPNLCSCSARKYRVLQHLPHFSEGFFSPKPNSLVPLFPQTQRFPPSHPVKGWILAPYSEHGAASKNVLSFACMLLELIPTVTRCLRSDNTTISQLL